VSTPTFDPGDLTIHTRTFTVPAGRPAPATVTMTVTYEKPDGTIATPGPTLGTITYDGVGSATGVATYTIPATNTSARVWRWRWTCAGDIVAAEQGIFVVKRDPVLDI
jgi:hypothetical protein